MQNVGPALRVTALLVALTAFLAVVCGVPALVVLPGILFGIANLVRVFTGRWTLDFVM